MDGAGMSEEVFRELATKREAPLMLYNLDMWEELQQKLMPASPEEISDSEKRSSIVRKERIPRTAADRARDALRVQGHLLAIYGQNKVEVAADLDPDRSSFKFPSQMKGEQAHQRLLYDVLKPSVAPELLFERDMEGNFSRTIWRSIEDVLPPLLHGLPVRQVVSLGTLSTGLGMHRHEEAWFLQLHGRKAWWIGDASSTDQRYFGRTRPCRHLGAELPPGFRFCVQQPGEVLLLPRQCWHATCNIDDLVWGLGGQGQTTGWSALPQAVVDRNLEVLQRLLQAPGNLDQHTAARKDFAAAIDLAVRFDRVWMYKSLEELGPFMLTEIDDKIVHPAYMRGPLCATVRTDSVAIARMLVDMGYTALEKCSPERLITPFVFACALGHDALARLFARAEAEYQGFDGEVDFGESAYLAAAAGHITVLQLLKAMGANLRSAGHDGRYPLHGAAAGGQLPAAKALTGKRFVHLEAKDVDGNAPLHAAAEHGHIAMAEFLLEHGASLDLRNRAGMQALHSAALHGHAPLVAYLLEKRAEVNSKGQLQTTPLHLAASAGDVDTIEFLLGARANVAARDASDTEMTPLHVAALRGNKLTLEYLLENHADIATTTTDGQQAVHLAAGAGHVPLVDFLLKKAGTPVGGSRNVNAGVTGSGSAQRLDANTQLVMQVGSQAAAAGHTQLLRWLADHKVDLKAPGLGGASPLQLATRFGHKEATSFLSSYSGEL